MEESANENESFRSPPRRRRSTFFERRESIAPQSPPVIIDQLTGPSNTKEDDKNNQLMRYYEKLLIEKNEWKNEAKNRRSKYHELRQQYKMESESSSKLPISFAALTNEDIEFVREKVNIQSKIIDSQQKLHQSFNVIKDLYERACQLDDVLLANSEEKVNRVTDYIFEHSTIEPTE